MSSIYKLSISGIRSFSDETQETIQFGKPLTLIVGTNGSGKTTIIECLRYATTNELPPNSKNGASFINDPNLHGSNETKAQIKLAFQNTKRTNLILSKSLMASKNPRSKTISFKTKENQLMSVHNGEKQTISSKVADIENLIPQHLGVSKAILNYVIFCHQDESLWPISESSILKKKFDEIFDSSKFIKILDSIKGITKEINNDVKLINNNVEHLKNDKTRSVNKKATIKMLKNKLIEKKNEMDEYQVKINQISKKLQLIYTSNQDYERTISKLESLQQDRKNMIKNIENIKQTTELLSFPKEKLLDDLNNFANVLAEQMNDVKKIQNVLAADNGKIENLRNLLNEHLRKFGSFESLYLKNLENLEKKDQMVLQFKDKLNIVDTSEFDDKLSSQINFLLKQSESVASNYNDILNSINKQKDESQFSYNKEIQHLQYMNNDIKSLNNKIIELESRYVSIEGNQTKLVKLREDLTQKEESFKKIKSLNEVLNLNLLVDKEAKSINMLEFELEDIQNKLQVSRLNNDLISKIQVLKDLNDSSNRELDISYDNIKKIIREDSKDNVVNTYADEIKNVEKEINKSKAELETKKFRKSKLKIQYDNSLSNETKLNDVLSNLTKTFSQLQLDFKSITDNDPLDLRNYNQLLSEFEDDYDFELNGLKNAQFLVQFNKRAIEIAESKKICHFCLRKFDDDDSNDDHGMSHEGGGQLPKFIELLRKRVDKFSSKTNDEAQINKKEEILSRLKDFKSNISKITELKDKSIPELKKSLAEDIENISQYDNEISMVENQINEKTTYFSKLKNLEQDISIFKHQSSSIMDRSEQINKLNDKLLEQGGIDLNFDDLEKKNKEIYQKLKASRQSIESIKSDRDMKQRRNNELENDVTQLRLSISDLELKSLDKINIEKAIEETKNQASEINKNVEISKKNSEKFKDDLVKYNEDYENQLKIRDHDLKKINDELDEYNSIKNQFSKINDEINYYNDNNINDKYRECKSAIAELQNDIQNHSKLVEDNNISLKKIESLVSNSSNQERNIRSNLNLIQFEEDLDNIENEIGELDSKQAYAQRDEYLVKISKLQESQKDLQRVFATKLGESSQIEIQIKDIYNEIERDYKDIETRYSDEYSKLQTKLAMATDLTTLYKATDNGVMEYHQTQILKINNIIDELWKKTYTGNDVETIKIKADPIAAKKSTTTTASNNRSYNYRVVMIKNGTELDMRGRCSAGQKVLASIIIRIALAECFCLNFGMIALDEPTTNLDDENIESLARALHSIIIERSVQRNFQLIIITHDEKFLRCMNAVDFTDHYYRVMRNERLNSTINKVSIATVTE